MMAAAYLFASWLLEKRLAERGPCTNILISFSGFRILASIIIGGPRRDVHIVSELVYSPWCTTLLTIYLYRVSLWRTENESLEIQLRCGARSYKGQIKQS